MLQLAGDGPVLEVADHGGEELVVPGVQVVEDGLGELARGVECVQEAGERARHLEVTDRVGADVGTQALAHSRVVVAQRPQVKLLHPVPLDVHHREMLEQGRR